MFETAGSMDKLFLVLLGIGTYVYAGIIISKTPDSSSQHSFSLGAMMAGLIAFGATTFSFLIVEWVGSPSGYLFVVVIVPLAVRQVTRKLVAPA